jgi:integrase
VLRHAHDEGALVEIPTLKFDRKATTDRPRPSFKFYPLVPENEDEYAKLIQTIKKHVKKGTKVRYSTITDELYDLIELLVHLFVRPTISEVFSLRFRHIRIREDLNSLQIEVESGKTGFRIVSSTPEGLEIFRRISSRHLHLGDDAFLFLPQYPNRDHARRIFSNQFNHVLRDAELKADSHGQVTSLYSLRHLAIQKRLVESGGDVNLFFLAKNCGTSVR